MTQRLKNGLRVLALLLTVSSAMAAARKSTAVVTGVPPTAPVLQTVWTTVDAGQPGPQYVARDVNDPDSTSGTYTFDWGDGTTSAIFGYFGVGVGVAADRTWPSTGTYLVRAKVTDEQGNVSPWSNVFLVTVIPNRPPATPTLQGPSSVFLSGLVVRGGTNWADTRFIMSGGRDPAGSHVKIRAQYDWGDGQVTTTAHFYDPMLDIIYLSYRWKATGTYSVRVRSGDEAGAWSAWSAPISVTVLPDPLLIGALAHDTSKGGFGVQTGDRVVLFFNGPTTEIPLTQLNINDYLSVPGKSWGKILSAVWRTGPNPPGYLGMPGQDGLEITFAGSGTTVTPGDEITAHPFIGGPDIGQGGPVTRTLGGSFASWLRGDANGDGQFTPSDYVALQNFVYQGTTPPPHLVNADVNSDGQVTPADLVQLMNWLYLGITPPRQDDF